MDSLQMLFWHFPSFSLIIIKFLISHYFESIYLRCRQLVLGGELLHEHRFSCSLVAPGQPAHNPFPIAEPIWDRVWRGFYTALFCCERHVPSIPLIKSKRRDRSYQKWLVSILTENRGLSSGLRIADLADDDAESAGWDSGQIYLGHTGHVGQAFG